MSFLGKIAAALALVVAGQALADGIDPLYDGNGTYIGTVEIVGDVVDRTGTTYARLDVPALALSLYVDPDAIYVMLTKDNPIIRDQIPMGGYWVGRQPDPSGTWSACDLGSFPDHTGRPHRSYGDLVWTNLRYSEEEGLVFAIDLGHCGDMPVPWVVNKLNPGGQGSSREKDPVKAVDHRDICGNDPDVVRRALGCSQVIADPASTLDDVTHALWTRAYVRCGGPTDDADVIADLVTAARLDPKPWQTYFRDAGGYRGPIDGRISSDLVAAVGRYVAGGCR